MHGRRCISKDINGNVYLDLTAHDSACGNVGAHLVLKVGYVSGKLHRKIKKS